ncbi:MAG: YifB family Mg chelatase-like AAA ATPase [Steroidobacteraceae bacterium]
MGFAEVLSRAQTGLAAPLVRVEVHLGSGLPNFMVVGLPAPVVKESRERVRAALAHCGFELPAGRITVNLAPADLPKVGGRFDLPIALGILIASGQLRTRLDLTRTEFYGELALTGELKSVPGLLLAALHAGRAGHALVIPRGSAPDVSGAGAALVFGLAHLRELAEGVALEALQIDTMAPRAATVASPQPDLADVRGQWQGKRALLIAAAGFHSLLMKGPPGSGKTMLAQRLPGLLPPLGQAEALEVAAIAAVAQSPPGTAGPGGPSGLPPFRAPHHTASAHAIVGGGVAVQPGEISLAHHGVLFLDELPEFDRRVLEGLREPLESGRVSVVGASPRADKPPPLQQVAAMNPCPCGRAGLVHPRCRCQPAQVERYRARISGPLLDRIDLQLDLPMVDSSALIGPADAAQHPGACGSSAAARELVCRARQRQLARQGKLNAKLEAGETLACCRADAASLELLRCAARQRAHSARSQHRVLRVARSIADLADRDAVSAADVAEALALRWEA